jgi:hypothetical protein
MSMKTALRIATLVLALFGLGSAQAQVTAYTDRAAWEAAVGSFAEESFGGDGLNGFTIIEIGSGHSYNVTGGLYWDRVVDDSSYTIYSFETATTAFGAQWNLLLGGLGQGLRLAVDGVAITPEISNTYSGFFGFTSTAAFDAVTVFAGSQGGMAESHSVDNLVYATAMPVPEPATYLLMIAGLVAIGWVVSGRMK